MTRIPKMAQTAPTSRPRPVIGTTCKKIGSMEIFLWIFILFIWIRWILCFFLSYLYLWCCFLVFYDYNSYLCSETIHLFEINCQLKFYVFYVFNNKSVFVFSPLHTQRWSWWWAPTSRRPASFPLCPINFLSRLMLMDRHLYRLKLKMFKITRNHNPPLNWIMTC